MRGEVKLAALDDEEIVAMRRMVADIGEPQVLAAVRLSKGAFTRALAGLPVQLGSRELIRGALGRGGRHAA